MGDTWSIKLALVLMLVALLVAAGCGGGKSASRSVLPGISGGGTSGVSTDRGFAFTEEEIPGLDPQIQELLAHPGWSGPPSPQPPVSGAPMPPPYSVEDSLSMIAELMEETEELMRSEDPVVPVRGTSYQMIPPPPDYFPEAGEYDPEDYDPEDPPPPFGLDEDENGYEDLFEVVDQFGIVTFASFVKHGITIQNQFNRGSAVAGGAVSAVYQKARSGAAGVEPDIELVYREAESGFVPNPYRLSGPMYTLFNSVSMLKKISDPTPVWWYAVVISPSSEYQDNGGLYWESTGCPNETFAGIQAFAYDPEKLPLLQADEMDWDENGSLVGSLACKLESSEHNLIQELIDQQVTSGIGPYATFPVMGMILQRWIDDRYSPFTEPWEGRLGWPLSQPVINRNGRVLTGPLGQYYQYYQYFEKGFMWWNDYISPDTPDELYIYMYSKDCTLEQGGEYVQDPTVVRYGLGGPLGMVVTAWPLFANVGDPIYFHAFPYGGPTDNENAFLDDFFVWNFRDGNYYIGDGTDTLQVHEYFTEAKFTTRVMLVLDVDGDGGADGATPEYVFFADAPEVEIGHLGEGGGGGGGEPTVLIVEDNTGGGSGSLQHSQAVQGDLDEQGWDDIYDTATTGQITDVSQLEDYLCVIWCPGSTGSFFFELIDSGERARLTSYIQGGGNVVMFNDTMYNSGAGYPSWQYLFGGPFTTSLNPGYDPGVNLTGGPAGSGPGGAVSILNKQTVWTGLCYSFDLQPNTTVVGYSTYSSTYLTALTRDNLPSADGGRTVCFGTIWTNYTTTQPSGVGRSGVLLNILNYIDPDILTHTGGGGGDDNIVPYDGPVDIADIYGWIYDEEGGSMDGGTELDINVVSGAKKVNFECVARAATDIDLVYEWEFEPNEGFNIWTQYTAHTYSAGIDVDGDNDTNYDDDDWFDVTCRVYDSNYSYATAPPESRDIDYFAMRVSSAVSAVWIDDNGTVFADSYEPDEVTGDVTVTLEYSVGGGDQVYDSVWVDYDYDFITFTERVEITPTPGPGDRTYNLTIPDAESREYYIAIRVTDNDAPNVTDTYAWLDPVKAGGAVCVVNDGGTANVNAIEDDLDDLGIGYTEINSGDISSSADLEGYQLVIWCPPYSASTISSTEESYMMDYVDAGGNVFIPYSYMYSTTNTFKVYNGSSYIYTWFGSQFPAPGSSYVVNSGPGGTITTVYCTYHTFSDFYYGNAQSNTSFVCTEYGYVGSYMDGAIRDNLPSDDDQGMCGWWAQWDYLTTTSPSSPGRSGALANILDYYVSDLVP